MITRRGVGLLIVAIAGFFVASATRVGWLHVADAVLVATLLLSAAMPQMSVMRLRATARFVARRRPNTEISPVVGDQAGLEVTLENRAPVPRIFVGASVKTTHGGAQASPARFFFAHVPPRSAASASGEIVCARRGWQSVDQVVVECRAPFGLFRSRRRRRVAAQTLVYPMWFPMRHVKLLDALRGDHAGRRPARRGEEIAGSRRYVAGDAMRDMHWKNTARTGRPTVKEFDAGVEEALTIAFETGAVLSRGPESTLEYAINIAASVSRVVMARGGAVRLATDGNSGAIHYDWAELMKRLAVLEPATAPSLADFLHGAQPGSRVLAIVAMAHQANVAAIADAARRGVSVAAAALDGFEMADGASDGARMLSAAGVPTVVCHAGQLGPAIAAIERGAVHPRPQENAA